MYCVYWIHRDDHQDHLCEGYVGVTSKDPEKRFREHCNSSCNPMLAARLEKYRSRVKVEVLHSNLSKEDALRIENEYRPNRRIGWNISQGGIIPPSRLGVSSPSHKLKGEARTAAQREASVEHAEIMRGRKPWNAGKKGLQTMSEDHKRAISKANSKPKVIVTCPHCSKSGGKPVMMKWHFENCRKK